MCTKKNQSLFINRIVYLKRRPSLILWYALIPFVTVVHKSLVYKGMVNVYTICSLYLVDITV